MNPETLRKFSAVVSSVGTRVGLRLFALVELEDTPNKWDVVISADWFSDENLKQDLDYLAGLIRNNLTPEESTQLSRLALLRPTDAFVVNLLSAFRVEAPSMAEIVNTSINGLLIRHAYVLGIPRN